MFLWGLAWHNIRRNWARTGLVIIGMATAAFIMTTSMAFQTGHLPGAYGMYRTVMGGDLVIYPVEVMAGAGTASDGDDHAWSWQSWSHPWVNDLAHFHPSLVEGGFVHPQPSVPPYFDPGDLPTALLDHPDVVSIEPYLVMPGVLTVDGRALFEAPLRAVDIQGGVARGWNDLIVGGRFFAPEDEGTLVALVNVALPVYWPRSSERQYPVLGPHLWEFLEINVPALTGYRDGYPVYDYSRLHPVRLRVVGTFNLYTGDDWILDEFGGAVRDPITSSVLYFPHYWHTPQVMIPASTWHAIYGDIGGGHPLRVYQLGVQVRDTMEARTVAHHLEQFLPGSTVRTVGDQALMGEHRQRVSNHVPPDVVPRVEAALVRGSQPVSAPDLSRLVAYLSFALAGCLVMANMHVLVTQRRRELGVLRAVGMSGGEVVLMMLYEIIALSIIGAALGSSIVQLLVGMATALSGVGIAHALQSALASAVQVVGATVLVAIVFGLWPAMRAARATTMEVLTGD